MNSKINCQICGRAYLPEHLIHLKSLKTELAQSIDNQVELLCRNCLNQKKIEFALARLEKERGSLSEIEKEISKKAAAHISISKRLDKQFEKTTTPAQKLADQFANFIGSWIFISGFIFFLGLWIGLNFLLWHNQGPDPYPFILLNLVLSCLAAIQAPVILMAQNRISDKDRMRSEHDYAVDLKAELEIASLHEKIDHLLNTQWQLMIDLQKVQLDLLKDIDK
jgi:uncharacterized membrane protein